MAPQNIPHAISVLTLGNKVILYCRFRGDSMVYYFFADSRFTVLGVSFRSDPVA